MDSGGFPGMGNAEQGLVLGGRSNLSCRSERGNSLSYLAVGKKK